MMDRDTITRTGARAPGVGRSNRSHGGVVLSQQPRRRARNNEATGDTKDGRKPRDAMSFKRHAGRPRSISQPSSRTGENPPYGSVSSEGWRVQREMNPAEAKARSLAAWMAGRRETNDLKPIDNAIVRMAASHRAAAQANAQVASKGGSTGGRARFRRVKAAWRFVRWLARYSTPAG